MQLQKPIVMQVDNKQAMSFQKDTCVSTKLVGVYDMRDEWVQDLRNEAELRTVHVPGIWNKANVLTKCLSSGAFNAGVQLVQGGSG